MQVILIREQEANIMNTNSLHSIWNNEFIVTAYNIGFLATYSKIDKGDHEELASIETMKQQQIIDKYL